MKILTAYVASVVMAGASFAQQSNSFANQYNKERPFLNYHYDSLNQIHDYSNNWDFDGDGHKDKLWFVGTGGAHLYYYLRLQLSRENKVRTYSIIESDFPMLPEVDSLHVCSFEPVRDFAQFYVGDLNGDKLPDIFIRLNDETFAASKRELKKLGVTAKYVLISFEGGKLRVGNYTIK